MHIGIDYDNTLVDYTPVFASYTKSLVSIPATVLSGGKTAIRTYIRSLPEGNRIWTRLQCKIYGEGVKDARLAENVMRFLQMCHTKNIQISIISHKTKFCSEGKHHNIRIPAYAFLNQSEFYTQSGVKRNAVFFEQTLLGKLARIRKAGCSHFIDDLPEIFQEKEFPKNVIKILFSATKGVNDPDVLVFSNWKRIQDYFFPSV